jgi:hypothetical protein
MLKLKTASLFNVNLLIRLLEHSHWHSKCIVSSKCWHDYNSSCVNTENSREIMSTKTDNLMFSSIDVRDILAFALLFGTLLVANLAYAADEPADTTAYVDSVHSWGAWELDIEPAAGGISGPSSQPLMARNVRVSLNTFNTSSIQAPAIIEPPVPTVAPVDPQITPTPGPTPPPVVPPVGGPADGLF